MSPLESKKWGLLLKWATEKDFKVNLYRPPGRNTFYKDFKIQIRMPNKVLEVKHTTLLGAIEGIKNKLLSMKAMN